MIATLLTILLQSQARFHPGRFLYVNQPNTYL